MLFWYNQTMNEQSILEIIQSKIGNEFIGDDCAYLKDLGIVISQDSLVEDIHFKRDWCTPYQLGYKSIAVNISDILASGAQPKYITIALSMPKNIDEKFVSDFYEGAQSALCGAKIVGGDITGSIDKIVVSVTAIGSVKGRNISSRANAKDGYAVITKGLHGSSSAGLAELMKGSNNKEFIKAHLEPKLEYEFSQTISTLINEPYAMMDTSDGLADALFKIAESSGVSIKVDYDKISHLDSVTKEQVLFGGEDYKLVAAIPERYITQIHNADLIGYVYPYNNIKLDISGVKYNDYSELKVYNHFGENNE